MATTLKGSLKVELSAGLRDVGTLSTLVDTIRTGAGGLAAIEKALTDGTTANKAQKLYAHQYTTNNSSNTDIDLQALTDRKGAALSFSSIKWFILRFTAPATGRYLLLQPGPSDAWAGWFGGTSPTEEVRDVLLKVNQIDGWAVSGSSKVLRAANSSGGAVTWDLVLIGH